MATNQQLIRIEQENGVAFGLRWSLVGLVIALCILSGCSSLFDSGTPRYNTVQGPKRAPNFNPGGVSAVPMQMASAPSMPPMMLSPAQAYPPYPVQGGGVYSQPMMPVYAPVPTYAPQQVQAPMPMQQQAYPAPMVLPVPDAPPPPAPLPSQTSSGSSWMPDVGVSKLWNSGATESPMPPVINAPPMDPMEGAPVRQGTMSSLDVPLAPDIQRAQPTSVPAGLIPPQERGYMEESRYSQRRLGGSNTAQ